ncbi:MAG: immunoglobulin domain-containing protein [Acidobacteria bacterium]|nr:immunoglobulin domain-containing protein [Acidobacteriota bacterium]
MMRPRSFNAIPLLLVLFLGSLGAPAQVTRGRVALREDDRVILPGNTPPALRRARILGKAPADAPMERMILALRMSSVAQDRLKAFLQELQDPRSPQYHRWLDPEEFGRRFGPSPSDLDQVQGWLRNQGFQVDAVAPGGLSILFSGTREQVEWAFRTPILQVELDGVRRQVNLSDPSIPRALEGLVHGVVSLHDIPRKAMNRGVQRLPDAFQIPDPLRHPLWNSAGGQHYLAPGDFHKIYSLLSLIIGGTDGTGVDIAITGRTNVNLADTDAFRTQFRLGSNTPTVVLNGPDPGIVNPNEETEACLDIQWSGAVAPKAAIKLVVSKSTATTDGVDLSAQHIVTQNLAPVMSTSFGDCESAMGSAGNAFYANLWAQAAAQGISSFVASGDSGPAECDDPTRASGTGPGANGLASTPHNIAVGGTQFDDSAGGYWASSNAVDGSSVLKYIPELPWNESGLMPGGSGLWAGGGGPSALYPKPAWQSAPGVPSDGKRDLPDVSLSAAAHVGYLVRQGGALFSVGGTSASSPAMAGIMALVVQKTGKRQGNANPVLYRLGELQYGASGPRVFHDVNSGNNSVPGVPGHSGTPGYDLATGLGSVDGNQLVTNWDAGVPPPGPTITSQPQDVSVNGGLPATFTVAATGVGTLGYQWRRDGTDIPGATAATYTTAPALVNDNGAKFRVAVKDDAGTVLSGTATLTVTGCDLGSSQVLKNPGFESGDDGSWINTTTYGVPSSITNHHPSLAHSGSWFAWLCGWPISNTETLTQTANLPPNATSATLKYWLWVDTIGGKTGPPVDFLKVQVKDGTGALLGTLATFSNQDWGNAWVQRTGDLLPFKGQTVQLHFEGSDASNGETSFLLDDLELTVSTGSTAVPASITTPPASVVATAGQAATFTVVGAGTPTLQHQWRKGGSPIPGATAASYTIPSVQAADAGSYDVTVSNCTGTATSAPATLTVANPVTVAVAPKSAALMVGGTQSFAATVTGSSNTAVTWALSGPGSLSTVSGNPTVFTAPSTLGATPTTATLTATSVADPARSDSVTVTIRNRDLNPDGNVDVLDLATLARHFGQPASAFPAGDLDGSGTIDEGDLALFLQGI